MNTCLSFKVKCDSEGNTTECRARANADAGSKSLDHIVRHLRQHQDSVSIIRTICAIAAQENLMLYQFDIKGAFLMVPCKEHVYMNLPGRYRLPSGKTLRDLKLL